MQAKQRLPSRPCLAGAALVALGACQPAASLSLSVQEPGYRAICNGELAPTLYPDLPAVQHNAVVAICEGAGQNYCSGTLISSRVVLTAAHCLDGQDLEGVKVCFGPNAGTPLAVMPAESTDWFLDYTADYARDIAVITLAQPHLNAMPIPIRGGELDRLIGHWAQAVGYGLTAEYQPGNEPVHNNYRYWTDQYVENLVQGRIFAHGYGVSGIMPGDSGGPLLYAFSGGPQVAGVVSLGETYGDGRPKCGGSVRYTAVAQHADWIWQKILAVEDPQCEALCGSWECGVAGLCDCGACPVGAQCLAGACVALPAGTGGVCVDWASDDDGCSETIDCPPGQVCYTDTDSGYTPRQVCAPPCAPDPCATTDEHSYCQLMNTPLGRAMHICVEGGPGPCVGVGNPCRTPDDRPGYCLYMTGQLRAKCYGVCEPPDGCDLGFGCRPYQDCSAICRSLECGDYAGCHCPACPGTDQCVDNTCQPCAPSCHLKDCGPDGCGGTCGSCDADELCTAAGLCQDRPADQAPDEGCGCRQDGGAGPWALLLLGLWWLGRRPRSVRG